MIDRSSIDRGHDLEREIETAIGCLPGVVVYRNAVIRARAESGARVLTGIGGKGAPDLLVEVRTPSGVFACAWLECKSGEFARLSKDQRAWHAAAAHEGRHVYVVRSVEHAREIVESFQRGEVFRGE